MKRNWEYKKLGDVCDFINGFAFKSDKFRECGLPVLRISNIKNDIIDENGMVFFSLSDYRENFDNYEVLPGDIVIAMSGATTGKIGIHIGQKKYYLNQRVGKFVIKDHSIDNRFLFYYLKTISLKIFNDAMGVAQPNISSNQIKNYDIPVPPLAEQQRIVAELDLLTDIIDKQNTQLKELNNLAQAIFYDMFGDLSCDECALIELCVSKDDIKCGPFGTQLSKSEYQKEGVAVWGIPQINSHFIIPPSDYVSQEKAVALKDYSVVAGDIVMSRKGNVGQCSVFPDSFENGIIHSDVLRLRLDYDKANSIFMMYQLHLSDSIKHQIQLVSSGAIMPGINVTKLKNIKVQVPPLALQQSFAEKIQSIEKQKETIRASIADTQKLLDYTMDKYFG
ncbi:restriction endonuclease subunit S [Fibrobacter sp.]|uniref:restriction endonuclease subunit S n=1 Tax=Fibrobacter sp. TaxID=35828 RepID=UPI003868C054